MHTLCPRETLNLQSLCFSLSNSWHCSAHHQSHQSLLCPALARPHRKNSLQENFTLVQSFRGWQTMMLGKYAHWGSPVHDYRSIWRSLFMSCHCAKGTTTKLLGPRTNYHLWRPVRKELLLSASISPLRVYKMVPQTDNKCSRMNLGRTFWIQTLKLDNF